MRSVVVTGVSTGIGRATALAMAGAGYRVFGSVRRQADAEELSAQLGDRFVPLLFDVTDAAAITRAADEVRDALREGETLAALVNNAGAAAGAGPLQHADLDEVREQLEVNVIGLLAVTQAFLPLLGARRPEASSPGRIVNVSSVGGRITAPFIGAYSASKHAVEALSEGLRRELMLYGIDVIVVGPGAVRTAIWDKAAELDVSRYADTDYGPVLLRFRDEFVANGRAGLDPSKVAAVIRRAVEAPNPRVRYTIVGQRLINWTLPRLLPKRWIDRILAARFGMKRGR